MNNNKTKAYTDKFSNVATLLKELELAYGKSAPYLESYILLTQDSENNAAHKVANLIRNKNKNLSTIDEVISC